MDQGKNAFISWKFKQHFTLKKEGERNISVQCNLCLPATNLLSAPKDSTSNLKKHLKRKHSSVLHRAEMTSDDGGEGSAMPTPPPLKQATLSSTSAITQSKVNSLVLEFIIADVQPFSLVENASFREMIAGISGGRTHMCRKTLMQRIERGFQNMKEAITETLQDVQTVCTTADIWTAHHRSFMGITCNWIEPETLDRKSAVLACERIRGRHTYDVIAAKVSQIHAEFQIQGKVSATVTDNGSNFVKAFNEYGGCEMNDEMDSTDDVQFADVYAVLQEEQEEEELNVFLPLHHQCAAHTLNLIATTDLDKAASQGVSRKLYRNAMSKCAAIWNKANRSSGAADAIEEIAQMRCLVPSVTRWSSEYHAIEKLMSLTESQLNGISDQLKLGEKNCYFGYIVPTILSLKAKLAEKLTQVQFSAHILSAVIKAIDTQFGQVLASHEARMVASTIPKFRLWWLADEERGAMKTAMVQESRLLHKEPSEDAGTTGNAAVGGDPEDDENFFTF
uniref:BED-type domain-containing protein n=1 Tax=Cyprinus carpio carpio TaxID=630221 RepID=A0A9J7XLQ1_CYPCA